MKSRNQSLYLFASLGIAAFGLMPPVPLPSSGNRSVWWSVHGVSRRRSLKSKDYPLYESPLSSSLDNESSLKPPRKDGSASNATALAVQEAYPESKIFTITLAEHRPLGCTIEESMDIENDPTVAVVTKVVAGGSAEREGIQVGDILIGVTGLFGDVTPVWKSGIDKIKGLVGAVPDEDPLTIQVARGTGVLERHEASIVDLCQTPGAGDKEVEECMVEFLAAGYATTGNDKDDKAKVDNIEECDLEDDEADCMINSMLSLWADELPMPSTTSGITDASGGESLSSKPKPWSSRSSGSGTFVRDPVTGEMRNIDA